MDWITLLQIVVAAGLGAAIGMERELGAQPAGLRTHMLVCLGAAVFTLAGADLLGGDPTRVAAQVVTGIGFLGGGAILREGATVRGLTTAASLWLTAAIGLAVGLQAWFAAVVATVLGLAVLWLVKFFEHEWFPSRRQLEVVLALEPDAPLDQVEARAHEVLPRSRVQRVSYSASGQSLVLSSRPEAGHPITSLGEKLRKIPGVHGVEVSH